MPSRDRGPRPLGVAHFQWWRRVYGTAYETAPSAEPVDALFRAIRDNDVAQVQRILQVYPHLGFTKGSKQRTALYVASFFARFEVVKLLVARGADRQLPSSDGVPPSTIIGYGRKDAVGEMKVRCLLADAEEIHVLLVLAPEDTTTNNDGLALLAPTRRVQVHFSEPVDDFIEDDLRTTLCIVEKLTRMSPDFFSVTVRLTGKGAAAVASVELPAGVVHRSRVGNRGDLITNVSSNVLRLG